MTPEGRPSIPLPSRPVFPLATREDLLAELESTDRAIDRLGQGTPVDEAQRQAALQRHRWWRDRIAAQLEDA